MKYILSILIIAALCIWYFQTETRHTPIQNISSGIVTYGKETLDSLTANGLVTLEQTTIRGLLDVTGSVKATNAQIGALSCMGTANLTNCRITNACEITGFLDATGSTFQNSLTISAQTVTLTDCTLQSIVVKRPAWVFGAQVVELNGKTIVKGSITFEAGNGTVRTSDDSKVLGKVVQPS